MDARIVAGALRCAASRASWERASRLATLDITPTQGAAWQLDHAATFRWSQGTASVMPACLRTTSGGRLCVQGDWPRRGLDVSGTGLSMALLQGYLPERDGGGRWQLHGELALDAQLRPAAGGRLGRPRRPAFRERRAWLRCAACQRATAAARRRAL